MTIDDTTRDSTSGKCAICGGAATGFWDGVVCRVEICAECGVTKIMQLVVDAIPRLDMPTALSMRERMDVSYWRATAARFERENKQVPAGPDRGPTMTSIRDRRRHDQIDYAMMTHALRSTIRHWIDVSAARDDYRPGTQTHRDMSRMARRAEERVLVVAAAWARVTPDGDGEGDC